MLELKDKFNAPEVSGNDFAGEISPGVSSQNGKTEAIEALIALGYTRGEAASALAHVKDTELSAEDYIKAALKNLI